MKFVRAYLRASTTDQDAIRARAQLEAFAADRGLTIAAWYVENESGAKLARPELFRLLADSHRGDVILIEQIDRLSRLTESDWQLLKAEIASRHCRIVALDLPTSHIMTTGNGDAFTGRMFDAINGMLLDMLAAIARKGLHRPPPPAGAGHRQGQGRGPLQGPPRGHRAQRRHRRHA
jgi:DNA invertase Pin-like site-specific DNA recombinase